ncbi:MAG: SMC family ATPase [Pelovirga sp.]
MQILSIHLKNIKSHRELDLDFAPGINVLSGPNGIGKSTIFEAIGYALFGVDAQSFVGNVERFISIGARRGEIALVFQVADGERFRVSRSVGTPAKWLLARALGDAFEVEEHKDIRETEARLKELLGLDNGRSLAEQFELVIGPFQNDFLGPFVIRQPTRRRDKFDEILGIDTWRKTFNETKQLASALAGRIEALHSAIGPLTEQVAVLPEKRLAQEEVGRQLEATRIELAEQQAKRVAAEAELQLLDQREGQVKDIANEVDRLKERIANGREKISAQQVLISEARKAQDIVAETHAEKGLYEALETQLGGLRDRLRQQRQLEQEVAGLDKRAGALSERFHLESRAVDQLRTELGSEETLLATRHKALVPEVAFVELAARLPATRDALNRLRKEIGQLDGRHAALEEGNDKLAEGICPFLQEACLNIADKPPGDLFSDRFADLAVQREHLRREIDRLEKEEAAAARASDRLKELDVERKGVAELTAALETRRAANEARAAGLELLQGEQARAQQALEQKQQELYAYKGLQDDIDRAEVEQRQYCKARDLYVANRDQAEKLAERQAALKTFEDFLARLQSDLEQKEAQLQLATGMYDAAGHKRLREQKDLLVRTAGALEQKIEGLGSDALRLRGEIDKLLLIETEIAAKQAQVRVFQEQEERVRFLRNRVFRHVSTYLSERFRKEISHRANRIYRIIAEADEELCWGEDYRILLRDMVDGVVRERVDDQLSGGQTMSAVVALRLAMLQTIGSRIAFFDEPTSNLDATRRENLAHAFRAIDIGKEEVTEHWYDQLFLVSHDVAFTEVTDQIILLGQGEV